MGDTKWGFTEKYAHRTLPFKWHHAGFTYFDENSSHIKPSFRPTSLPAYRDDFLPLNTDYREREQNNRWAMSCYGCHRDPHWQETLRIPRNPFSGSKFKEMKYMREFNAVTPISSVASTPRRASELFRQLRSRASSSRASTRSNARRNEDVLSKPASFGKWAD
mmetsp:Transcript_5812/g.10444  ORF Transcript_5812/g.10444 Transcript_5812/m.10444 type:complete len:163 (-) Transcript_5812:81-569(-)